MRLLWYGDAPTAATGFGTVSRNVLNAIHKTGEWSITVLGVNYYAQAHDFPYQILPAGYPEPDPFGKRQFLRLLYSRKWDLVVINNDSYVVHDVAADTARARDEQDFRLIYYYPVDLKLPPSCSGMVEVADQPVAYSLYGRATTLRALPHLEERLAVIPHGSEKIDTLPDNNARREWRRRAFGQEITDETFVWINVNRNSVRKDIARSIQAFAAFNEYNPRSIYYVHCQAQDNGLDMQMAANEAGVGGKVGFPNNFSLSSGGYSREQLYLLYRCADGFLTTHLGEGWGLTVTEAMSADLPVVAPNNTTMPEILGPDYPYLYPCEEEVYVDNTGYRPRGSTRAIFEAMKRVYEDRGTEKQGATLAKSLAFTRENSWENVGTMWLQLIESVMATDYKSRRAAKIVEAV